MFWPGLGGNVFSACFLRRLTLSSPLAAERKERRQSRYAGSSIRSARGSPDWLRPCLHHGPRHDYSGGQVPGRRLHAHSNRDGLRGSRNVRNEFASVLDFIRPGDVLVVVKLDRLGRNMRTFSISCTNLKKKEQAQGAGACHRYRRPNGTHGPDRAGHGRRDGARLHP